MENVLNKKMKYQWVSIVMILVASGLAGCTKEEDKTTPADLFAGTWHMSGSCVGGVMGTGNMYFGKGSDDNSITYSFSLGGSNDCVEKETITGTVDGNKATFGTTLTDGCGMPYNVNAQATISHGVLTFTFNTSQSVGGSCTATGTRTKPL